MFKACSVRATVLAVSIMALPALDARADTAFEGLIRGLYARAIGPANPSGRIVELAVYEKDPNLFFFAAANGGVWKTTDGGKTSKPVFDNYSTIGVGSVAMSQTNPSIVWVGTGEGNIIRSGSWGGGVYKSTDGGETFTHMGLTDSKQNARIAIHPTNPNIVYVAALGHAWGPNAERGLYRTTDGGATWRKLLGDEENTGCIEVQIDPQNPNVVYAGMYHYRRDAFSGTSPRIEWGPGSGLFRSADGGETWTQLGEGLPEGPLGRIGVSIYRRDPRIVYAVVQGRVRADSGIYRSNDRGNTWEKVTDFQANPPFFYGQIRVDPSNPERIYALDVQILTSEDGGKTTSRMRLSNVHVDHHALWINPEDSDHLILGNDGGVYISFNRGANFDWLANHPLGQFYAVGYDMAEPYNVMGGVQDNGSWHGPSRTYNTTGVTNADFRRVGGGDGFYVWADPTDPNIVYSESQYGRLQRYNFSVSQRPTAIQPRPKEGEPAYNFNWNTPLLISHHEPATIYFGGQFLFRSRERGDNWETISPDLTRGRNPADTGHTITTIDESKVRQGVLWVGTDDGRLHVSQNDGGSWTEVTDNLPGIPNDGWISRVETSHYDAASAFVSVDRRRNNDYSPYIFRTPDYGQSWTLISGNLPKANVHVVRQSSRNPNLLFAGTERGVYTTLDGGVSWRHLDIAGIPKHVITHDLQIHPRERELIVGTHGRSFFIIDIAPLEQATAKTLASPAHIFEIKPAIAFEPEVIAADPSHFVGENPPYGAVIHYWLGNGSVEGVSISVSDSNGTQIATFQGSGWRGLNTAVWDLSIGGNGHRAVPGEYMVTLTVGDRTETRQLAVQPDPRKS